MTCCFQCPDDHHPNKDRDSCIPKDLVFLSFGNPLGATLVIFGLSFSIITAVVLGVFMKHHETPIVKANNRNLSYVLLTSLLIYFLSSFLHTGQPQKMTCLLQPCFDIAFSVVLSCLLAKNILVVLAFRAKRPGSPLQKCLGKTLATLILLSCSFIQSTICLVWLMTSPPFPDVDDHLVAEEAVLVCNTGSVPMANLVLIYQAFLSFLTLTVAFLTRTLPDSFNEAKFISFSLLVVCSFWLFSIPVYLSTKKKYVAPFIIISDFSSAAAVLACVFFPKCYIIVFRPYLNKREHLMKS